MFICSNCKQVSEPKEPQHKVVTQKRQREYNNINSSFTMNDHIIKTNSSSKGWEIVKEEALCSECFENSPFNTTIQ